MPRKHCAYEASCASCSLAPLPSISRLTTRRGTGGHGSRCRLTVRYPPLRCGSLARFIVRLALPLHFRDEIAGRLFADFPVHSRLRCHGVIVHEQRALRYPTDDLARRPRTRQEALMLPEG